MSQKKVEAIYALSPSQQGMLFESLAALDSGLHVEQTTCALSGRFDPEAFEQAWLRVAGRHPILRTAFAWKQHDEPLQVVLERVAIPITREDWQGSGPAGQAEKLERYLDHDRQRGFDPSRAPLMRLALFQLGPDRFQFVWTVHHLVVDGWCVPVILHEVVSFYEAFRDHRELELPPVRPYRDYIAWLKRQSLADAEQFWRKKLAGFTAPTPLGQEENNGEPQEVGPIPGPPLPRATAIELSPLAEGLRGFLPLPAQRSGERAGGEGFVSIRSEGASSPRPSPPLRRGEGESSPGLIAHSLNSTGVRPAASGERDGVRANFFPHSGFESEIGLLPSASSARLQEKIRHRASSLPTVLQALWALLLSRSSGLKDVVFGVTVSGRPPGLPGVETIVGLFINTVPMRFRIPDGATPFWDWVGDIQAFQIEQRPFEYCSSGQIHPWSEVPPFAPLYESIVVAGNFNSAASRGDPDGGLQVENMRAVGAQTRYPLTIMAGSASELRLQAVFARERFEASQVRLMIEQLLTLLDGVARSSHPSIAHLCQLVATSPIPSVRPRKSHGTAPAKIVPPRDFLELQLARIWEELLRLPAVGVHDNFFAAGGHSLLVLQLRARLQKQFRKTLPLTIFFERPTIEQLAMALRHRDQNSGPWSPLVAIEPRGSRTPLFCLHPLGGGVLNYLPLSRHLGPEQPVYGLQAAGLDPGQEPHESLEAMIAAYLPAIRAQQPRGPYRLAGLSFGGLLAFEAGRQLAAAGESIGLLALLDTPAPGVVPESMKAVDDAGLLVSLFSAGMNLSIEALRALPGGEQLEFVLRKAVEADLLPAEVGLAEFRRIFRVWKTYYQAAMNYQPQRYPGPIALFRAREASERVSADPALGWTDLAEAVHIHWVPGSHETMDQEPQAAALAARLAECLGGEAS